MKHIRIATILLFACLVPGFPQGDEILRAMKDEMDRSMAGLRMENQPSPYYIAYTALDLGNSQFRATLGAPVEETTNRYRILRVEVRVGTYDFDSSRFVSMDRETGGMPGFTQGGMICTLDGNYDALRRLIFGSVTHTVFKDILNASEERILYNYRPSSGLMAMADMFAGFSGDSAGTMASLVVPNLIFEELELQKAKDIAQKPPIVPSPLK